jgi:hypothetical protein
VPREADAVAVFFVTAEASLRCAREDGGTSAMAPEAFDVLLDTGERLVFRRAEVRTR